ncbi:MAG: hypothetical protein AAGF92_24525 [Myxococcota bacterium]
MAFGGDIEAGVVSIRLLGPVEVSLGGSPVELPPSKKARALLAHLVATGRPQRRDRLCELFWELPENPRASLRWSLSRLRKVLNCDGVERLVTDRTEARFEPRDVDVDLIEVRRGSTVPIDSADAVRLLKRFRGDFLQGLDLPDCLEFSSWKAGVNDECRPYLETLLERALEGNLDQELALRFARRLVELRPKNPEAHITLIRLLGEAGRVGEADERFRAAKHLVGTNAAGFPLVVETWRGAQETSSGSTPAAPQPRRDSQPPRNRKGPPAVAVLPFDNMSGNPEEQFFADGTCEEIITELARARLFPVIARNSSFAFKGLAFDIRDVGEQLGARYVVEGSVRRAGTRIRVVAQLVHAESGRHLWADRFDRPLGDIFALQDEIAQSICGALRPELVGAELRRLERAQPQNLEAWQELVLAWRHEGRTTREDLDRLREHAERALALDPTLAAAHATIGAGEVWRIFFGQTDSPEESLMRAAIHGQQACALDPNDSMVHSLVLTWVHFWSGDPEQAIAEGRLAIELNPSDAAALGSLGVTLVALGELEEGREHAQRAMAMSPRDPLQHIYYRAEASSYYLEKRFELAAASASGGIRANPDSPYGYWDRAAALAQLGRLDDARRAFDDGCICRPDPDLDFIQTSWPLRNPEHMELLLDGLRKAGWKG